MIPTIQANVEVYIDTDALADVILAELAASGGTAIAVAVTEDGQPVWSPGFGNLTTDGSEAVRADTLFWVASLTKPIAAIATLQRVKQGCLQLDVPVSASMDFDMSQQSGMADSLLVGHTLNMTGGLVDCSTQTGHDGDGQVRLFLNEYQDSGFFLSPPGRMFSYSNSGLVLAGRPVEVCSGEPLRESMDGAVWTCLGTEDTALDTMTVVNSGSHAAGVTTLMKGKEGQEATVSAQSYLASHLWPAMGA